jgi:hypothetical protein
MGVFGAPTAYGDDAEPAVRVALGVRDWAEESGLAARIAVNTGGRRRAAHWPRSF